MKKVVKVYIKPNIKVNDFISRNYLLGWGVGKGSTDKQWGNDPSPRDIDDPSINSKSINVWENDLSK